MKVFKSQTVLKFVVILVFFCCADIQAMFWSGVNNNVEKSFDVKMPLSEWPIVNSLTTERELEMYRSTWNPENTKEKNQQSLVDQFMKTCCNFSFKKRPERLRGISVGRLDNGEDIIFAESGTNIGIHPSSGDVLIYNEKESRYGLKTHAITNIFLNLNPLDFTKQMREEFRKCISELTKDPVGCEVLRIAISRYKGGTKKLPKLTFIPVKNRETGLAYTTNSSIWRYLKGTEQMLFDKYKKYPKSDKFMMFSPKWFKEQHTGLFLRINPKSSVEKPEFSVNTGTIPKEVIFLHQLIYALSVEEDSTCKQTQLIEQRAGSKYFYGSSKRLGDFFITNKQACLSFFLDDNVYRTMFGFTKYGWDLINESSYLAHRYGIIRPIYLGINAKFKVNEEVLSPEELYIFLVEYLKMNGDHDLFWHCLFEQEYPEFGKGSYRCSDISDENLVAEK
ncbi:MAG: hypothetical protein K5766_04920 [Alphaproteobacteria bacterium]|nr:hypothetical protein [Alphaproteobacteria bacterium]